MKVGVVILAAGASRRMGRPKLLLRWNGISIINHLMQQWIAVGASEIATVVSLENVKLIRELDRQGFPKSHRIVNARPEEGMFSSIQCAARWKGWAVELTHVVLTLGDQPHLRADTLRRLIEFAARNADRICQPSLNGNPKHPVLLPRRRFDELASTGVETLKQFLQLNHGDVSLVEIADEGLSLDIDTPEDYDEAVCRFSEQ